MGLSWLLQKSKGQKGFGLKMCGLGTNEIIKSFKKTRSPDLQGHPDSASRPPTGRSERMLLRKTPYVPFQPGLKVLEERPSSHIITSTYTQKLSRKQVLMRTRAWGWKKDSEGSQMSQGLLGGTSPKLRKKELDFPGMDLQSFRSGKKRVGLDVIYVQQTSQTFHI